MDMNIGPGLAQLVEHLTVEVYRYLYDIKMSLVRFRQPGRIIFYI